MFSVCYVLVDTGELKYFNQMMISIRSLQLHYDGEVNVILDTDTLNQIQGKGFFNVFERYSLKYIVENFDYSSVSKKKISRLLKTSLRKYVQGDFLYLDTDTIIADDLGKLALDSDIAMLCDGVFESHQAASYVFSDHKEDLVQSDLTKKGYFEYVSGDLYFNSGVIWCKDTELAKHFFNCWYNNYVNDVFIYDQIALYKTNKKLGYVIQMLDPHYNVQVYHELSMQYFEDAKIIHYFNYSVDNSTYILSGDLKYNFESKEIDWLIENPKKGMVFHRKPNPDNLEQFFMNLKRKKPLLYSKIDGLFYKLHQLRRRKE